MPEEPQIDEIVQSAIYVRPPIDDFFRVFDEVIRGIHPEIESVAAIFRGNLISTMDVAMLPFSIIVMSLRISVASFHKLLTGEDVDFVDDGNEAEDYAIKSRLQALVMREDIRPGLVEHLSQTTVLLWGSFEAFAKDLFVVLLNLRPELTEKLKGNNTTQRYFDLKNLKFDDLSDYDYDFSRRMGDFLIKRHSVDSFVAVKEIFLTILPENDLLRNALNCSELRKLNLQRHLIVHRHGVVDQQYLDKTNDELLVGDRLTITPKELDLYLHRVLMAGVTMLYGARSLFSPPDFELYRIEGGLTSGSS